MANPRKFSEKIALQKQKQAEGTAEFEKIMKEVYATKMDETQVNQKILECCLGNANETGGVGTPAGSVGSGGGGGSGAGSGASGGGASPEGAAGNGGGGGGGGSPTAYRESRGRSVGVGPMRRPSERKQDRSPYGSTVGGATGMGGMPSNAQNIAYLSPPMDSSWRRSNSDSALHQSLNMAVAAEEAFLGGGGLAGLGGMASDMNALHAHYQLHNQRSHSPNIGRSLSPQAQRRKGHMLHQQQQQQQQLQQQHLQHNQQHQQHHQHPQQQLHMDMQQQQQLQMHQHQQHMQQMQQHHQQQNPQQHQPQHFNAKFPNCNMPANSLFKSLQDQASTYANTGSLPDLTSLHYAAPTQQQLMHQQQQQQQQQQQTLSPTLSPHNNGRERDQSPSPFSPAGAGGGGPPSPYHQQQHSPTSAAATPTTAQTSSPHLSFTNLAVQSPNPAAQNPAQSGAGGGSGFGTLPTLGAASSTGNLTDYRQPLNPPSPGSSPGLLTSVAGNELHTSAPASPIRHPQHTTNLQQNIQGGYSDKNVQTFDRYSANTAGMDASYNSLNPSFHNHFEQFSLGDSNSSPEQQQQMQQHFQQQQNSFAALEFEEFVSGGNGQQQQPYSQNLVQNKILDFNDLTTGSVRGNPGGGASGGNGSSSSAATACNNNNLQQQQQQQQQNVRNLQQLLNNNSTTNSSVTTNGPCHPTQQQNNNANLTQQQNDAQATLRQDILVSSPIPSPLGHCGVPSPSSPLPIPMSSPHNHHQLSLSLHSHSAQHSPHHSPLHSPHHSSPLSVSSPGVSTLGGGVSPAQIVTSSTNATSNNPMGNPVAHNQQQQQLQQQQLQNHANTPTTTNIPSIIFSDYSSNSDFSREIFDSLDLDLGHIDVAGLQMLSDHNTVMIADPTTEDSFRRDLN